MPITTRGGVALTVASVIVALSAMMIAMWSFAGARPIWGAYNLAIALVAIGVSVAVRARNSDPRTGP